MIVEERIYRVQSGKVGELVGHYDREGIPIQRPILGNLVAAFTSEVGGLNLYIHMWAYESFEERMRRRGELMADERWKAFLPKVLPLIETMENRILLPTPFSPVQ